MPAPDELSRFVSRLESIGAPYMVTGATAAILYGQPRVTNDLGVVLSLDDDTRLRATGSACYIHVSNCLRRAVRSLTWTFHTLLSCAATQCSKIVAAVAAVWSVQVIGKTLVAFGAAGGG